MNENNELVKGVDYEEPERKIYDILFPNGSIKVRQISVNICDLFECILDKHNITIPDNERTGDEVEARLYGETYSDLEDAITNILADLIDTVKENPDKGIDTICY